MAKLTDNEITQIIEAALFTAGRPMSLKEIVKLFAKEENITLKEVKILLSKMQEDYKDRGVVLQEVASGFRFQVNLAVMPKLEGFYEEKPAKYSRALMETLALIAYKQPITRGEIEDVRGVGVSSNIINTLLEHEWIKSVGTREVPGRPTLYATTEIFLDYFNLKSLAELPTLQDLISLEEVAAQLKENVDEEKQGSLSLEVEESQDDLQDQDLVTEQDEDSDDGSNNDSEDDNQEDNLESNQQKNAKDSEDKNIVHSSRDELSEIVMAFSKKKKQAEEKGSQEKNVK